jgi:hypothetical protein
MGKTKPKPKRKKRVQTRTIDKRGPFLAAYVATASLTAAAEAVGVDRTMHYRWMKDAEYAEAFDVARQQAGDTLEDDAVHWARIGVYEPLVYQGRFQFAQRPVLGENGEPKLNFITGEPITEDYGPPLGVHRRSEGLMARLLKAFMPARYADRGAVELTGANGGPIENSLTVTFIKPKS